jgi:hypothetical protein
MESAGPFSIRSGFRIEGPGGAVEGAMEEFISDTYDSASFWFGVGVGIFWGLVPIVVAWALSRVMPDGAETE